MERVTLFINNRQYDIDIHADDYLLDTLRSLHFMSVKKGCDNTTCGVCTVLVDNKPVPSCSLLTVKAHNKHITTVEGLANHAEELSQYFGHEGADQCGFCNPSLALNVFAMIQENPSPSDEDIKQYLVGNLCRCTGYQGQHKAIKKYLENRK